MVFPLGPLARDLLHGVFFVIVVRIVTVDSSDGMTIKDMY